MGGVIRIQFETTLRILMSLSCLELKKIQKSRKISIFYYFIYFFVAVTGNFINKTWPRFDESKLISLKMAEFPGPGASLSLFGKRGRNKTTAWGRRQKDTAIISIFFFNSKGRQ